MTTGDNKPREGDEPQKRAHPGAGDGAPRKARVRKVRVEKAAKPRGGNARKPRGRSHRLDLESASEVKRQTFYALENPRKAKLPARIVGFFLFFLIVANAVVVFFSSQPGLDAGVAGAVNAFYTFSTVCFMVEYVARVWIADLAFGNCTRAQARLKYVFSPLGIIDFLSFAPNVVAWFIPMTPFLRTLVNVVRLVRLVKISRYMRGLRAIGRVLQKRRHEIVASFLVLFLLIIVASVVMYEIENPAQPERFNNLLSGIYWAVTTITATGYGDLVPITPAGRIVGSIIMFLSVALVAIPGGIFSAGFVAEFQNANYRKIERDIKSNAEKQHEGDVPGDGDDGMRDGGRSLSTHPADVPDGRVESERPPSRITETPDVTKHPTSVTPEGKGGS